MWKSWVRCWFGRRRHAWDRLVWSKDRLLLNGLVFRLEHFRNDAWELGEECFRFYKDAPLVSEFERYWETHRAFEPRNVLELGVWDGGSLAFWMELLRPDKLVGVDVMDRADSAYFRRYVAERRLQDRLVTHWRTDQRDIEGLRLIASTEFSGPLDLVIDDASHAYDATKASFEAIFPLLRPGGLYLIEDWAWGHWPEHNGPNHAFARTTEPTRLIEELVHAVGSSCRAPARVISEIAVHQGFAVAERGPESPVEGRAFRLEDYIVRRPVPFPRAG